MPRRRLLATPLAAWERDGLKAALLKARLPADDVGDARVLFWRFETTDIPVGFGGLEIHGSDALLRSLVTLPPLRQIGMGAAMVAVLETGLQVSVPQFIDVGDVVRIDTAEGKYLERAK